MFSTKTSLMIEECNNLERQVAGVMGQIYELEHVVSMLNTLSNLDEPIAQLNNQIRQLTEEQDVMRQMMQGLNKISLYYMNCENRICNNGEQSTIRYERQQVGITDYSAVAGMLDDFLLG